MKNDQVEKKVIEIDGVDLEGLIMIDEYIIEDDVVMVQGATKTTPVRNGVKKIPAIGATFKITRDSSTLKFLEDWYYKFQTHDIILKRTDGAGNEFAREMWPDVECAKLNGPAYDASAPATATAVVNLLPDDIIPLAAES